MSKTWWRWMNKWCTTIWCPGETTLPFVVFSVLLEATTAFYWLLFASCFFLSLHQPLHSLSRKGVLRVFVFVFGLFILQIQFNQFYYFCRKIIQFIFVCFFRSQEGSLQAVQKGSMFCCGSRSFIKPVQESLKHCFMKAGKMTTRRAKELPCKYLLFRFIPFHPMFEFYPLFDQSIELLYYFCSVFVCFFIPGHQSTGIDWQFRPAFSRTSGERDHRHVHYWPVQHRSLVIKRTWVLLYFTTFPPFFLWECGGQGEMLLLHCFDLPPFLLTKEGFFMSSPTRNAVFGIVFSQGMLNSHFGLAKLSPIFALDKFVGVWWWGS